MVLGLCVSYSTSVHSPTLPQVLRLQPSWKLPGILGTLILRSTSYHLVKSFKYCFKTQVAPLFHEVSMKDMDLSMAVSRVTDIWDQNPG